MNIIKNFQYLYYDIKLKYSTEFQHKNQQMMKMKIILNIVFNTFFYSLFLGSNNINNS